MANNASSVDVFVLLIALFIASWYVSKNHAEVTYVKSSIDDRSYLVRRLENRHEAADRLALIAADLTKLVHHVYAENPGLPHVKRLYENFNPSNISEGSPTSGYTSYSVNKGERIVLCIRQKDAGQSFADRNVVMYVAIHELAHLATSSVGHDSSFWDNFRFLLEKAIEIGVYERVDYNKNPAPYCGIQITNSIV